MKCTPFHAAALVAVISLSALSQLRVFADSPSFRPGYPAAQASPSFSTAPVSDLPKSGNSTNTAATSDRHLTRGQYLARTALSFRGRPYRWGGTSSRTGFDCSGLVQAVCAKWGILLPRVAHGQYRMGQSVKKSDLQPGDLVFFKDTYKRGLSHVGIFIGEGRFVHAASAHLGVMVSRLDSGYHLHHWAGARRLDLSKLPPVPGEAQSVGRVVLEEDIPGEAAVKAWPTVPVP